MTIQPKQEGFWFKPQQGEVGGSCVCVEFACSHMLVWVFSRYFGLLPQSKDSMLG